MIYEYCNFVLVVFLERLFLTQSSEIAELQSAVRRRPPSIHRINGLRGRLPTGEGKWWKHKSEPESLL